VEPQILEMVCAEILEGGSNAPVAWDDIAGQAQAKLLVQELVVWPMLNPHLFKANAQPQLKTSPSVHNRVPSKSDTYLSRVPEVHRRQGFCCGGESAKCHGKGCA
jgi:hypothetical protein